HFNGGTITWRPANKTATGSPVEIIITQIYSWSSGKIYCTDAMIVNEQAIDCTTYNSGYFSGLKTQTLNCIGTCSYVAGGNAQGYNKSTLIIPYCTDTNPIMGTNIGQRSDEELLYVNDDFNVAFQSTSPMSWIALALGPSNPVWSISCNIDLHLRPDGYYNTAPVATMMSPINIQKNVQETITIPVSDANDGDILKCRWASGTSECGDACPPSSLPTGTTLTDCTITITGTVNNGYYAIAVMVEDYYNSSSTSPMSSVPVQFLLKVVTPTTCATDPYTYGILPDLSCTPAQVSVPFNTTIYVKNNCPVQLRRQLHLRRLLRQQQHQQPQHQQQQVQLPQALHRQVRVRVPHLQQTLRLQHPPRRELLRDFVQLLQALHRQVRVRVPHLQRALLRQHPPRRELLRDFELPRPQQARPQRLVQVTIQPYLPLIILSGLGVLALLSCCLYCLCRYCCCPYVAAKKKKAKDFDFYYIGVGDETLVKSTSLINFDESYTSVDGLLTPETDKFPKRSAIFQIPDDNYDAIRQQSASSGYSSIDLNVSPDLNKSSALNADDIIETSKSSVSVIRVNRYKRNDSTEPFGNSSINSPNTPKVDLGPQIESVTTNRPVTVSKIKRQKSSSTCNRLSDQNIININNVKSRNSIVSQAAIHLNLLTSPQPRSSDSSVSVFKLKKLKTSPLSLSKNDPRPSIIETIHLPPKQQLTSTTPAKNMVTAVKLPRTDAAKSEKSTTLPSTTPRLRAKSFEGISNNNTDLQPKSPDSAVSVFKLKKLKTSPPSLSKNDPTPSIIETIELPPKQPLASTTPTKNMITVVKLPRADTTKSENLTMLPSTSQRSRAKSFEGISYNNTDPPKTNRQITAVGIKRIEYTVPKEEHKSATVIRLPRTATVINHSTSSSTPETASGVENIN
ncbi:unnamed protein product, partial [Didymodactylos carnosus]